MTRNYDFPFSPEIAAMENGEYVKRITSAYHAGERDEFIRLGQRLAWGVVVYKFRDDRLRTYWTDMTQVALIGLIEVFDRNRRIKNPVAYLRGAAKRAILTWLYAQHIIRRKNAKHADIAANSETIARVGRADPPLELSLAETIVLCLQTSAARRLADKLRDEALALLRDEQLALVGLRWIGHAG